MVGLGLNIENVQHHLNKSERITLDNAVACPIAWRSLLATGGSVSAVRALEREWLWCFAQHAVDDAELSLLEGLIEDRADRFDSVGVGQVQAVIENARSRFPLAATIYQAGLGRFANIQYVDPAVDQGGKHFKPGYTNEEALAASRKGPSLFFDNPGRTRLREWFWAWFSVSFKVSPLSNSRDPSLFVDPYNPLEKLTLQMDSLWQSFRAPHANVRVQCPIFGLPIGACHGIEATEICFDVLLSGEGGIVHAYPITKAQSGINVIHLGYVDLT